jgi:hypothetical protein
MSNTDRINYSIQKKNELGTGPIRAEFSAGRTTEVITKPNEYEAQVKAFRIETTNQLLTEFDGTSKHSIALALLGGVSGIFVPRNLQANEIRHPKQYLSYINTEIDAAMSGIRALNPAFQGGINDENPFVAFDGSEHKYTIFIPKYTSPYGLQISFSPEVNRNLNLSTLFIPSAVRSANEKAFLLDQPLDLLTTVGTLEYYRYYSQGIPQGLSDIDSIIIQTSQIPVAPTFEGETNDVKNIQLKVYKPSILELFNEEIIVNYTTDNYFSLNSHYPVKSIDIQFFIRRKNGTEEPFEIFPANSFSCELEFKRIDKF